MVFSSHIFLFYFLPAALAAYFALAWAPQRWRNGWLALAGYAFYGWANPKFIVLMFGTTFVDWLASLVVARDSWWPFTKQPMAALPPGPRSRRQHAALMISIVSNLLTLGFFKYFHFSIDSYNSLVSWLGFDAMTWHPILQVVLPLGISFYTFQSLSYIIDVYRGHARAMANFVDFSCFVSMFPHLVAGPILQFSFLAEQIENRTVTLEKFSRGVALFSLGLGKKVLIANPDGRVADLIFSTAHVDVGRAWYGLMAYTFQIYFDFSGYSDMAIGLGLMLGFVFAKNFDAPYRSASITEFWRRWHISLSTWLRDYLYVPLGGNRHGTLSTYRNLMLTMLLGGLWHGASWNFVIWGAIHGGALAIERRFGGTSFVTRMPRAPRVALTFLVVSLAWVFFRAPTLPAAREYFVSLMGLSQPNAYDLATTGLVYQPYYVLSMVAAAVLIWTSKQAWDLTRQLTWARTVLCMTVLGVAVLALFTQSYNPFIYYIF